MMIEKIKNFGQSLDTKKTSPVKHSDPIVSDNIQISDAAKVKAVEAKFEALVRSVTEHTLSLPEDKDRTQKIADLKQKINNSEYDFLSTSILEKTADRLVNSLYRISE